MAIATWPLKPLGWLFARRPAWRDAAGLALLRLGQRGQLALAVVIALACTWDQFVQPFSEGLSNASFDTLMRSRPIAYAADPRIVVLDIDEASLGALSRTHGRWPWPRQVLAEVATAVEAAGAQAVVWDVLFADPDTANPASEAAFDTYVRGSRVSFYPVLRLNPENDHLSQLTVEMLSFAVPVTGTPGATVSLVAPYFRSIYESTRMGTFNVQPDADNRVRHYVLHEDVGNRRIPSLPLRMATAFGWPVPEERAPLLNWPRPAAAYATTPFHEAVAALREGRGEWYARFADKVVIIGATAPALFDLKATPIDPLHPGVYVLATAIDNTRNGSFLRTTPRWAIWIVEIVLVIGWEVFRRRGHATTVSKGFFVLPTMLLGISLLSVSVSTLLLDLTVPVGMLTTQFALGLLFDRLRKDFAGARDLFAFTPAETTGRVLQVAALPAAHTVEQALAEVARRAPGVRLWEPADDGFDRQWRGTPWVLWRWAAPAAPLPADGLAWIDVTSQDVLPAAIARSRRSRAADKETA